MGTVDSAEDTVEVICRTDKCEAETVYLSRRQLCNSSSFLAAKVVSEGPPVPLGPVPALTFP